MADRAIQLASNLKDLSDKRKAAAFAKGGYMSEKLDGVWMAAVCGPTGINFYSASLEHYISFSRTELESELLALSASDAFVLIGEVYKEGVDQQTVSGIARTEREGHAEGIEFHVHDCMDVESWLDGQCRAGFKSRYASVLKLLEHHQSASLKIVEQHECHSAEEFLTFSKAIKLQGGEGAIFKPEDAEWIVGDRSTNVIRDKQLITYDLEVTRVGEVVPGDKGGLKGVIYVRWREWGKAENPALDIPIRGMKHKELLAWAEDPSLIVGKIVEVHAMTFTNLGMLREPRFKFVREDKDTADL